METPINTGDPSVFSYGRGRIRARSRVRGCRFPMSRRHQTPTPFPLPPSHSPRGVSLRAPVIAITRPIGCKSLHPEPFAGYGVRMQAFAPITFIVLCSGLPLQRPPSCALIPYSGWRKLGGRFRYQPQQPSGASLRFAPSGTRIGVKPTGSR